METSDSYMMVLYLLLGLCVLAALAIVFVLTRKAVWPWCVGHPYHLLVAVLLVFMCLAMVGFVAYGSDIREYRKGDPGFYLRLEGAAWIFIAIDQMKYFFLFGWAVVVGVVAWTRHEGQK